METPKCSECEYSTPEGNCNAAYQNPNKYRACINTAYKLPTRAQIREAEMAKEQERIDAGFCPKCQTYLMHSGGCCVCPACGWSACEG